MDIDGIKPPQGGVRQTAIASKKTVPKARPTQSPVQATASPVRQPAPVALATPETKQFPLPRYYAPERPERITRRRLTRKKLLLRSASALIALFLVTGGLLAWNGYAKFHKVFRGTSTVAALAAKPVVPSALNGEGDGRVNILLLGIGGPGHDGPDLTDTIVLLSVDPVNDTATMLSVPRDLWVKMPVDYIASEQKINAAYESGKYNYLGKIDDSSANSAAVEAGFSSIDQVMKTVFDVNINYHVLVNFTAFQQAIDTVGGITVNVPTPLVDPTMAWENHNNPILAPAGIQQMNGAEALLYARSRETTSDFARGQRQRQILVALKDKVLTAGTLSNPAKIEGLMNAFGNNVFSDLSTEGATRLYSIMKKVSDTKINSIGLTDPPHQLITTDHVGSTSVDRPVAGFDNYTDIQTYVRSQIPDGYIIKENAPIMVAAPTALSATTTATLLKSYGYNVTATTTDTAATATPILVDLSHGKDPFTLHYLENRYDAKPVTALPPGVSVATATTKFVILINK